MTDKVLTAAGFVIGFLFGVSGVATIFNLLGSTIGEAAKQAMSAKITQLNLTTTILLLIAIVVFVFKLRAIASLLIGAIIGAVLNFLLEMNGIHVTNQIYSTIFK